MRRVKIKKGIKVQRAKPPTPTLVTGALIGEEKQKKDDKERNRERVRNPATLDHLVASYDPHGSYGGTFLKPPPTGEYIDIFFIIINKQRPARINAKK